MDFVQKWFTRIGDGLWQRNMRKTKGKVLLFNQKRSKREETSNFFALPRYGTSGETEKVQHVAPKSSEGTAMIRI